jgi:hypothetical protein
MDFFEQRLAPKQVTDMEWYNSHIGHRNILFAGSGIDISVDGAHVAVALFFLGCVSRGLVVVVSFWLVGDFSQAKLNTPEIKDFIFYLLIFRGSRT